MSAAWLASLGLGLAAALVRLLPWVLDPHISWSTVGVFARGLVAVSFEVAAAVALPLGAALAVAAFQDRGEGMACLLAGSSPWSLVAHGWRGGVAVALLGGLGGQVWGRDAARPEEAASGLIAAARSGCDGRARRVSEVPGLGASWLCQEGEAPWLVVAPASGAVVQARAAEVRPTGLVLREVRWSLRGPPQVHAEVGEASLEVGRPFASGAGAPSWARWLAMASALLSAWLVGGALLAGGEARVAVAAALGVATAVGPLWLRGEVDAVRVGWGWLAAQPALAALPALAWLAARRRRFC